MAITVFPIPVANGRAHSSNTPTVGEAFDTNISKWTAQFDPAAEQRLHFTWMLPPNYLSGNVTMRLRWRANATTGDCVWKLYYKFYAAGTSTAGATLNTTTVTTTTAGSANQINESVLTLSVGVAANQVLVFSVARDAANAADTLAVNAELLEVIIEYTSDPTILKQYLWVTPSAFAMRSASLASLVFTTGDSGSIAFPNSVKINDASNNDADFRFSVPSNFAGNCNLTLCAKTDTSLSSIGAQYLAGRAALGASADPALTAGSLFSFGAGNTNSPYYDLQRALPITPVAGDMVLVRVVRNNADPNTSFVSILGVLVEHDVNNRNPASVRMDPASASLPATSAAVAATVQDTNSPKMVAQFADGSDLIADFSAMLPSTYSAGGTLRLRWRSSAAAGNIKIRVDWGSPANGSAADPALTTGTPVTQATAGAGIVNETTVDISSGLTASDLLLVRVTRLGSDAADTLSASVDLLAVVLDTNITP